jgi:hypothetical protein
MRLIFSILFSVFCFFVSAQNLTSVSGTTKVWGVSNNNDTSGYFTLSQFASNLGLTNYWSTDASGIFRMASAIERFRIFDDGRVSIGLQTGSKTSILGGLRVDSLILNPNSSLTGGVGTFNFNSPAAVPTIRLLGGFGVSYAKLAYNVNGYTGDGAYHQYQDGIGFQYNALSSHSHSFRVNNTEFVQIKNTGIGTISGSAGSPSGYFINSTGTGYFFDGGYGISVTGTKRLGISGTGNLYLNSANVFVGQSGRETLGGSYQNVGVGNTLTALNGGNFNGGFGYFSLGQLTTGSSNFAMGAYSQYGNLTGNNNVGVGTYSLQNVTGSGNIGVGTSAGSTITSGVNNIGIGGNSAAGVTTGSNNTAVGATSGGGNSTGSNNVNIGYQAGYDTGTPNAVSNAINIGNTIPNNGASNEMRIGNAANNLFNLSLGKFKLNVRDYTLADDNKVLTINATTNVVDMLAPQHVGNTNLTLTSDRYLYSTNSFYLGTPSSGAKFGVSNTVAGRSGTYLESVASNFKFDWLGSGTSYLTGTAYSFKNLAETVDYATINTTGIVLGSGKKVTGGITTGATGSDLISVTQANASYSPISTARLIGGGASGAQTLTNADDVVIITNGGVSVVLPSSPANGKKLIIVNRASNDITVSQYEAINGTSPTVLTTQKATHLVYLTSLGWYQIN